MSKNCKREQFGLTAYKDFLIRAACTGKLQGQDRGIIKLPITARVQREVGCLHAVIREAIYAYWRKRYSVNS